MNAQDKKKIEHLKWAVESRARNQRCAVVLLESFTEHEKLWKTKKWSRAAQDLLSVSFSLWRAAFLADKEAKRAAVFSHAREFLQKIIEDNAIGFPQDRKSNEWTFNYYTRNARAALQVLAKYWPEQVLEYDGKKRTPTQRWEYCQDLLDSAVSEFIKAVGEIQAHEQNRTKVVQRRADAKARRAKSRSITLSNRKKVVNV